MTAPFAVRVYRALLWVLPREDRSELADQLVQIFEDEWSDTARAGFLARTWIWFWALRDLISTALRLRMGTRVEIYEGFESRGDRKRRRRRMGTFEGETLRDIRYGLRALGRSKGFTLFATAIIALGIGANTTIFTLVNELYLEPPPLVENANELVRVNRTSRGEGFRSLAYPDYLYYRENNEVFDGVLAYDPGGIAITIGVSGALIPGRGWFVSDNYFDVLGTRPAAGRWFLPEEDREPGTHAVVIISHGVWQQAYGGDPGVIGATLELNGNAFSVVGVAPEGFRGVSPIESPPDVWVPIHTEPILTAKTNGLLALRRVPDNTWVWLQGMARLREGVTIEAAQANMDALALYLEDNFREWNEGWGVVLSPSVGFDPPSGTALSTLTRLLFSVVGVVLLIACANVAILLLARGSARVKDVGIRVAMGAGRRRIVRGALTESVILALFGGLLGVALAYWSTDLVADLVPLGFAIEFQPDARVFAFTLVLAGVTACLFGLLPAWQTSRVDVNDVLKGTQGREGASRLRNALVVGQVALSLMLVVAAGLFGKSLATASGIDLGFETEDRVLVGVNLRNHGYSDEEGQAFIRDALERIRGIDGVRAAATARMIPFRGAWTTTVPLPGRDTGAEDSKFNIGLNAISPGYFETLGISLLRGRDFTESDGPGQGRRPVIVNETLADLLWPGEDPLGRVFGRERISDGYTIVGVVADAQYYEIGEQSRPVAYLPVLEWFSPRVVFVAETDGRSAVAGRVQEALRGIDPSLAITGVYTMKGIIREEIGQYRTAALSVGLFAVLALILASAGLYGVLSYLVARRTREIGIQVALGASSALVGRKVVLHGLRLTLLGALLGIVGAVAGTRLLTSFLYGVSPRDPAALVGMPLLLVAVAVLASLIPALRASRVDPMVALQAE